MADIFLSYKKEDLDRLKTLIAALEAEGFTVWWDYRIETGSDWWDEIVKEVSVSRCLVGCWSANSVRDNKAFASNYVSEEHSLGRNKLAPVLLDEGRIPVEYKDREAANLIDWQGDPLNGEWRNLVQRVEKLATPDWVHRRYAALTVKLQSEKGRGDAAEALATAYKQQLDSATQAVVSATVLSASNEGIIPQTGKIEIVAPSGTTGFIKWVHEEGDFVPAGLTIAQIAPPGGDSVRLLAPRDGTITKIFETGVAHGNAVLCWFE